MQIIGYIRVSSDKQDLQKQEHLLLKYAQQHQLPISDLIQVEISALRSTKERRIDERLARLNPGDVVLVAELSRLGRNLFEVIQLINQLSAKGVQIIFVRQPELSTTGPHTKLLLVIYSYFTSAPDLRPHQSPLEPTTLLSCISLLCAPRCRVARLMAKTTGEE